MTTFLSLIEAMNQGSPLDTVKGIVFRRGGEAVSTSSRTSDDSYELPILAYDLLPLLSKYYSIQKRSKHSAFTIMYTSMEITYLKNEHGLKCVFFMDELLTMDRQDRRSMQSLHREQH